VLRQQKTIILQQKALEVEAWVIVEALTFVLNCVITAYVMNQS
jgi:hypothetical protein